MTSMNMPEAEVNNDTSKNATLGGPGLPLPKPSQLGPDQNATFILRFYSSRQREWSRARGLSGRRTEHF